MGVSDQYCPCGVPLWEGEDYCRNCGQENEWDPVCPNCGEKLDDPDICDFCHWEPGHDLPANRLESASGPNPPLGEGTPDPSGHTQGTPSRQGLPWLSEEETNLRELFESGQSVDEISKILGRTPGAIKSRLQSLGLKESVKASRWPYGGVWADIVNGGFFLLMIVAVLTPLVLLGWLISSCEGDSGQQEQTTISQEVPRSSNEIRAILTAHYPWGQSDEVSELQEVLGITVDGVYGVETRAAHLGELQARGYNVWGVPPRPTPTVDATPDDVVEVDEVEASCSFDPPPTLRLALSNKSSEFSEYVIEVLFESLDGTKRYGRFHTKIKWVFALSPYGSREVEITFAIPEAIPADAICRLTLVWKFRDNGPGNFFGSYTEDEKWTIFTR